MSFHGPKAPKIRYPSSSTTKKQVSLAKFLEGSIDRHVISFVSDGNLVANNFRPVFSTYSSRSFIQAIPD